MNAFLIDCGQWLGLGILVSTTVALTTGLISWCLRAPARSRHLLWLSAVGTMAVARLALLQSHPPTADEGSAPLRLVVSSVARVADATQQAPSLLLQGMGALLLTAMLFTIARGWSRLRGAHRQAARYRALATTLPPELGAEWQRLHATRADLLLVPGLHTASLLPALRPIVVIPAEWVARLSAVELRAVIAHEAAHVRNRDDWTLLATELAACLLVLDLAAMYAFRECAAAREMACDESAHTGRLSPAEYARLLLGLHDSLPHPSRLGLGFAGLRPQLARRVTALLSPRASHASPILRRIGALSLAMGGSTLAAALMLAATRASASMSAQGPEVMPCIVDHAVAATLVPGPGLLAITAELPGTTVPCVGGGVAYARRLDRDGALRLLDSDSIAN